MLVPSKIEIGLVDLEKNIFKFIWLTYFRYFTIILYLPIVKGVALHLKKPEFHVSKDALFQVLLNWPSGSGEEDEHVKSLQTDGQTNDGQ